MHVKEIVALFPGQGSQSVSMGSDLYENFKTFRETCEEASDVLGFDMARLCFQDPNNELNLTEFTQPALLTMGVAVTRTLKHNAPFKTVVSAGHSLGEYTALVHEGALAFADALKAVRFRGQAMQSATPVGTGTMAAYIGAHSEAILTLCQEISKASKKIVEVVNYNSPSQFVVSGHTEAVKEFCKMVDEKKLGRAVLLTVSAPFHSTLMAPAAEKMKTLLEGISLGSVHNGIVANVDAKLYQNTQYQKNLLVQQLANSVKWTQSLQTIQNDLTARGIAPLWIEFGPGTVLKGLVKKTLGNSVEMKSSMPMPEFKNLLEALC